MGADYWGINMYGIWENRLNFKAGIDVDQFWNGELEIYVKISNGKEVLIERVFVLDEEWICGYSPQYPWELCPELTPSSEDEVKEALWLHYEPIVNMAKEEFYKAVTGISTANWG